MNTRRLLALTLIFGLLASTAAAAPLAGPCVPGAAYNAAWTRASTSAYSRAGSIEYSFSCAMPI